MMALCPCLVDTPLSRAAMNVGKNEKFSSEMGMRALQSSEVAEAFERLVVSGGPGEALLVYPGLTFYWPNVQFWMFNIYCYISKFLIMVRNVLYILVCQVQRNPLFHCHCHWGLRAHFISKFWPWFIYLGMGTQEIRAGRAWSAWWSHDIFVSFLRLYLSRHATILGILNKFEFS